LWVTATRGATFTTTHWVVDGIHSNTTNARTTAQPAAATCFTKALVVVLDVTNFSDRCAATRVEEADFTGGHFDGGTIAIDRN
jgi:hypothetical protein